MQHFKQSLKQDLPKNFNLNDVPPLPLSKKHWKVQSLALDVSGSCNLACRYCAEKTSQPTRNPMNVTTLNAVLDFIFPHEKVQNNMSIRFGSGEPLLALSLLKRVDAYIKQLRNMNDSPCPQVFITTNGTLIDDDVSKWLSSSGWHVKISFDGPKSIHDSWRVTKNDRGTYDLLKPIIASLAKKIQNRLSVTAVLCKGTDPRKVFDEIANLGVGHIELVPVVHHDMSMMPDSADLELYREFIQDYARRFVECKNHKKISILIRFADRVCRVMGYNNVQIPCGAGRSFYGVDSNGTLYPCFRFIGIQDYVLGNIHTGINDKLASAFRAGPGRSYKKRIPCRFCWAASLCGGPCFSCAELFGPGSGGPLSIHCAYVFADAKAAVWLVNSLRKNNPERLLSFLPKLQKIL